MAYLIIGGDEKSLKQGLKKLTRQLGLSLDRNNPDLIIVEPDKSIGIEKIRQVKNFLAKKSWQSKSKLVVVLEAQSMTLEAQNAFLKTLEEPPKHSQIVLLCSNPDSLLPTIVSRCQIIKLAPSQKKEQDLNTVKQEWQSILKLPLEKRLLLSDSYRDKPRTRLWLKNFIFSLQSQLAKTGSTQTKNQIKLLITALQMVENNVGSQKVVDWLMIKV